MRPHHSQKLTESQEIELVHEFILGGRCEDIAEAYKIHPVTVRKICLRHGVTRPKIKLTRKPTAWVDEARRLFGLGVKCGWIAQVVGLEPRTIEQKAYAGNWTRESSFCYHCGATVAVISNRGNPRRCDRCRSITQYARLASRRQTFGRVLTRKEQARRRQAEAQRAVRQAQKLAREAERRRNPKVQLGRYLHYGESPRTQQGALLILQVVLGKALADRCEAEGKSLAAIEYKARYQADAAFRERERLRCSGNRWGNRASDRDDGTLDRETVRLLFARAKKCPYCWQPMKSQDKSLDHMEPLSRGGWHSVHNVMVCCRRCNSRKNDRSWSEWLDVIPAPCASALTVIAA